MIGRTVSHYRIRSELGRGGMGTVYLADDLSLGRPAAIKFLSEQLAADADARRRFMLEARAAAALDHNGICTVYETGEADGRPYIVMAYVEGETLRDRIARGPLPVSVALKTAIQVAEALQAAHARGIVHRDVKPANIMLMPTGQAKVMDFGLARVSGTSRLTRTGSTMGTAAYLSPEQAQGEKSDLRSDIWSLGVVLYEMVSGRRPFQGEHEVALFLSITNCEPTPLTALRTGIAPEVDRVVAKCLAKRADSRYQHADELVVDLRHLLTLRGETESIHLRIPEPLKSRRRRLIALAVGSATILAVAGLVIGSGMRQPAPARRLLVMPLEIRGRTEGAEYAGHSFAEAVAINLAESSDLVVLPVPSSLEIKASDWRRGDELRRRNVELLVEGSLTRGDGENLVRVTVVDVSEGRVIHGVEERSDDNDMGRLAVAVSGAMLAKLGRDAPRKYEYLRYVSGSPAMADCAYLPEAIAALRAHDPEAMTLTARLLADYPGEYEAHVMRIVALVDARNRDRSDVTDRALREGVEDLARVDPRDPLIDITAVWFDDDSARSIDTLNAVLGRHDLSPGLRAFVLRTRAGNYGLRKDFARANDDMLAALRLDPANAYNYSYLAQILDMAGRYDEAVMRYEQAGAIDPAVRNSYTYAGLLGKAGRWDKAAVIFAELCAKDDSQLACAWHATALLKLGQKASAREIATASAASGQSAAGAFRLACFWAQYGDRSLAITYLKRARELGFASSGIRGNTDLETLRGDRAYEAIVAAMVGDAEARPAP